MLTAKFAINATKARNLLAESECELWIGAEVTTITGEASEVQRAIAVLYLAKEHGLVSVVQFEG